VGGKNNPEGINQYTQPQAHVRNTKVTKQTSKRHDNAACIIGPAEVFESARFQPCTPWRLRSATASATGLFR